MKIVVIFLVLLIGGACGFLINELTVGKSRNHAIRSLNDTNRKFQEFYQVQNRWILRYGEGKKIADYFIKRGYKTVAIYGMRELGENLLNALKDSAVEVKYAIDKNADNVYVAADVYRPDEELQEVDVVVVTAIHYFVSIKEELEKKINCPIVSIDDVISEL